MTHLPSLVSYHGLVSEYWHLKIQILVYTHYHRNSLFLFYRTPRTDFKLCDGIYHSLSFEILCYLLGIYLDRHQTFWKGKPIHALHFTIISLSKSARKSDISHFTLVYKSYHTSYRLHIIPIRFIYTVVQ